MSSFEDLYVTNFICLSSFEDFLSDNMGYNGLKKAVKLNHFRITTAFYRRNRLDLFWSKYIQYQVGVHGNR